MAGSFTCDWCGHLIVDFSSLNKMMCYGLPGKHREWHLHRPNDGLECMEQALEAFDEICGMERPRPMHRPQPAREPTIYQKRLRAWNALSPTEQEHQILNALGTDRQKPRDVASKITAASEWHVWSSDAKQILDQMAERGDVERIKQPRSPGSSQHWLVYSRASQPLSPELEALERSLNDDEAVA